MSSTPTTASASASASATATAAIHHHTYWCHECDMSILLPPSSSPTPTPPPRCPHCHTHFLEHMDSFTPFDPHPFTTNTTNPTNSIWGPPSTTFPPLTADTTATAAAVTAFASDENFLLNSPYLQRLIQHLTATSNGEGNFYDPMPVPRHHLSCPASKRAMESLKTIKIDNLFLEKDPSILCPICKDQFGENSEAKELPCNHIYHSDCITPWLEINNTCPLCRFKLATEEDELGVGLGREETYVGAMRLEELVDDDYEAADILGFRRALMRMGNENEGRNESGEFVLSPTQIGEAGNGAVQRANSVETVSSWPTWTFEGDRAEVGMGNEGNGVRS